MGNFDKHGICETSIHANVTYEDSNEILLEIEGGTIWILICISKE